MLLSIPHQTGSKTHPLILNFYPVCETSSIHLLPLKRPAKKKKKKLLRPNALCNATSRSVLLIHRFAKRTRAKSIRTKSKQDLAAILGVRADDVSSDEDIPGSTDSDSESRKETVKYIFTNCLNLIF